MSSFADKDKKELTKLLADKRDALRAFRFAMSGGKTKNVREGRALRKDIARLLTKTGKEV